MTTTPPGGALAGAMPSDAPGLPRGRSGLTREEVKAAQRDRLLRGAIQCMVDRGYADMTISDVVAAARVSKKVFYEHFDSQRACVLAAANQGYGATAQQIAAAHTRDVPVADRLRLSMRAYLQLCAAETVFTRALFLELPAVGRQAQAQRSLLRDGLAEALRLWHEKVRGKYGGPPASEWAYVAAIGGVTEVVATQVERGQLEQLPALEDALVGIVVDLLQLPAAVHAAATPEA